MQNATRVLKMLEQLLSCANYEAETGNCSTGCETGNVAKGEHCGFLEDQSTCPCYKKIEHAPEGEGKDKDKKKDEGKIKEQATVCVNLVDGNCSTGCEATGVGTGAACPFQAEGNWSDCGCYRPSAAEGKIKEQAPCASYVPKTNACSPGCPAEEVEAGMGCPYVDEQGQCTCYTPIQEKRQEKEVKEQGGPEFDDCRNYTPANDACSLGCDSEDVAANAECPYSGGWQEDCDCYSMPESKKKRIKEETMTYHCPKCGRPFAPYQPEGEALKCPYCANTEGIQELGDIMKYQQTGGPAPTGGDAGGL